MLAGVPVSGSHLQAAFCSDCRAAATVYYETVRARNSNETSKTPGKVDMRGWKMATVAGTRKGRSRGAPGDPGTAKTGSASLSPTWKAINLLGLFRSEKRLVSACTSMIYMPVFRSPVSFGRGSGVRTPREPSLGQSWATVRDGVPTSPQRLFRAGTRPPCQWVHLQKRHFTVRSGPQWTFTSFVTVWHF